MRFILRGKEYGLTREEVITAARGQEPEPIRSHYVEIDGRRYPPKQVLAAVVKVPRVDFTTADAYNILRRLGFKLGQIEEAKAWKPDPKALEAARLMDELRERTGPIGVSVTELIKEGRRR